MDVHVILDNYATHKHATVRAWLRRHPRVHLHFIPTGSSWLNMVEWLFNELTEKQLRRLAVTIVPQLVIAVTNFLEHHTGSGIWQWSTVTVSH